MTPILRPTYTIKVFFVAIWPVMCLCLKIHKKVNQNEKVGASSVETLSYFFL